MILTPDNEFSAVFDASALVDMRTCELLMRCCEEPALFRIIWVDETLEELRALLVGKGYSQAQADLRLQKMNEAFPEAKVSVPKTLLACCSEIQHQVRKHVFAAAVREGAHVIVSSHFQAYPAPLAAAYCIDLQSPDQFLVHQAHLNPDRIQDALDAQATTQRVPRAVVVEKMKNLLPQFQKVVERF